MGNSIHCYTNPYAMHGTVWKWVQDWSGGSYDRQSPVRDSEGPTAGEDRVSPAAAGSTTARVRTALRNTFDPDARSNVIGFRLARAYTSSREAPEGPTESRADRARQTERSAVRPNRRPSTMDN
jgi:Sulfatase-modifying factor enzyme 1